MITRLAPTPSGYLHRGNAVNLLLVSWLARSAGGEVFLRIDDMDVERYRGEFVDDIFGVLGWLGIDWKRGPADRDDFERHHSLRLRTEHYRAGLDLLRSGGSLETYCCSCSRRMLHAANSRTCVSDCRGADLALVPGRTSLRAHVPAGTIVTIGRHAIDLTRTMGDFVVWRRDDLPSYQLASLMEDRDTGVTHVVRGEDLLASTAAQVWLAPALGAEAFTRTAFLHHALALDDQGAKLSKSTLDAGPMRRTDAHLSRINRLARDVGAPVGIAPG